MRTETEELFEQARGLPAVDRADLIEELFRSFDADPSATRAIDEAWAVEAEARLLAYKKGRLGGRPAAEVFDRLSSDRSG